MTNEVKYAGWGKSSELRFSYRFFSNFIEADERMPLF